MKEVAIQVPKGVKVRIEEVEEIQDSDPRIPKDRDVLVSAPTELKIAIKRVSGEGLSAKAAVTTMCG